MIYFIYSSSNFGIDFTDEGYYINWISKPYLYQFSTSQFGYIYHPLFLLSGRDIGNLRQFNLAITYLLALILCILVLSKSKQIQENQRVFIFIVASAISTSSFSCLIFFGEWLNSPSYNTLTFQSLMITMIGILIMASDKLLKAYFGQLILSFGISITFMAKPTSAVILIIVLFLYFRLLNRSKIITELIIFLQVSLILILLAYLIDASILKFFRRLRLGFELSQKTDSGHSFSDLFRLDMINLEHKTLILSLVTGLSLYILTLAVKKKLQNINFLLLFLTVSNFLFVIILLGSYSAFDYKIDSIVVQQVLVLGSSIFFVSLFIFKKVTLHSNVPKDTLYQALLLILFPYIYSFGTNNNYLIHGLSTLFFWILAILMVFMFAINRFLSWLILIPFIIIVQMFTTLQLYSGFEKPYRQPQPLRENQVKVQIGVTESQLILPESYGKYFKEVREIVNSGKFRRGKSIIDLTGQSPLTLFSLDADPIGGAWLVGGYPGSNEAVFESLKLIDCKKLSESWILLELDGPRAISTKFLTKVGLNFPQGYMLQGTWSTPENSSGWTSSRQQTIYEPFDSIENYKYCNAVRFKVE